MQHRSSLVLTALLDPPALPPPQTQPFFHVVLLTSGFVFQRSLQRLRVLDCSSFGEATAGLISAALSDKIKQKNSVLPKIKTSQGLKGSFVDEDGGAVGAVVLDLHRRCCFGRCAELLWFG